MPLAAGTRLGPYEVVAPIGKGGPASARRLILFGELWRVLADRLRPSGFVESRRSEAEAEAELGACS